MKNILLSTLFLGLSLYGFSQDSTAIGSRQGKLFFAIGTEYRITPIYDASASSLNSGGVVEIDAQSAGMALNLNLDYFVTKNICLGFGNSFRYDVIAQSVGGIADQFGIQAADNGLITDFHFYVDYHIKVFKQSEMFLRLGRSLSNRGTEYSTKRTIFDQNGDIVAVGNLRDNYAYEPWNFAVGYKKNKINLIGGIYTSGISEYFDESTSFIVPYVSFKYTLGKL